MTCKSKWSRAMLIKDDKSNKRKDVIERNYIEKWLVESNVMQRKMVDGMQKLLMKSNVM